MGLCFAWAFSKSPSGIIVEFSQQLLSVLASVVPSEASDSPSL